MMVSKAEIARSRLEQMVVFNELDSERMYSEKELAGLLGLGRTPVREALQRFSHDKMAVIHPRKGVQFPAVSLEGQLKLLEVRRGIEPHCVAIAASRLSPSYKSAMLALSDNFLEAARKGEEQSVLAFLRDAHDMSAASTENEYFTWIMGPLQGLSRRFWFKHKAPHDSIIGAEHWANILGRIVAKEPEQAAQASNDLLDYLMTFSIATVRQLSSVVGERAHS